LSIWSINPDGSSPTRLTDDKDRTAKLPNFVSVYDSSPVWSPDGTEIAFISNRNYLFGLYVMNADGSNARLLTELPEPAQPAWSPDGSKIVFSAGIRITLEPHKPHTDIYVINVDGSGLTQLTRDSGLNGSPSWSPDGKQIAFVSNRDLDGKEKIWIMNADGTNQRIISTGVYGGLPAWSPDGNKILFTSSRTCPADIGIGIYVMNADGSDSRLLTNDPNSCGVYSWPRWSPDGTKIVTSFQPRGRGDITPPRQIIVMNADGSNPINISNRGQYYFNTGLSMFTDVEPHWQPLLTRPQVAPSIIGFSAPSYTVNEKAGRVAITVTRTGNLNDVASCFYVTLSNTMPMLQHSDPAATGTLRFAPGESSKTISFTVGRHNADSYKLILSDNEGNATFLGGIKEATLTILR
jgi:TolB protein